MHNALKFSFYLANWLLGSGVHSSPSRKQLHQLPALSAVLHKTTLKIDILLFTWVTWVPGYSVQMFLMFHDSLWKSFPTWVFRWNFVDLMLILKRKKKSLFLLLRMKQKDLDQIVMILFRVKQGKVSTVSVWFWGWVLYCLFSIDTEDAAGRKAWAANEPCRRAVGESMELKLSLAWLAWAVCVTKGVLSGGISAAQSATARLADSRSFFRICWKPRINWK